MIAVDPKSRLDVATKLDSISQEFMKDYISYRVRRLLGIVAPISVLDDVSSLYTNNRDPVLMWSKIKGGLNQYDKSLLKGELSNRFPNSRDCYYDFEEEMRELGDLKAKQLVNAILQKRGLTESIVELDSL